MTPVYLKDDADFLIRYPGTEKFHKIPESRYNPDETAKEKWIRKYYPNFHPSRIF